MSANPAMDQKTREKLRSNLGIDVCARLVMWAHAVRLAYPTASVVIFGTALDGKDWRDIDVAVLFTPDEFKSLTLGNREIYQLGSTWDFLAASFTAHARQIVGAPVEVRVLTHASRLTEAVDLITAEPHIAEGT